MVKDLINQWGLVLGGSHGLGYASAKKLAQQGMNLIVIYRASRLQDKNIQLDFEHIRKQGHEFLAINADATRIEQVDLLVRQCQNTLGNHKFSLVLHSISKGNLKSMTEAPTLQSGDFEQSIFSMGISLYTWTQALYAAHLLAKPSKIISFTSEGSKRPMQGYAAVSAAKASLEAITRSIALEFAPQGISAICIQAGVTDTLSLQRIPNYEQLKEESLKRNPHGELTTPDRVAGVVYLMAKKEAEWINGSLITVDGGESLR